METIRNYLESMFANLPGTPEVRKAKDELWQMMEDKYTELKNEGKTENEAIGIVISEFGNLDELARDLGIDNIVNNQNNNRPKPFTNDMVDDYIASHRKKSLFIALGVFLCIISVCGPIFFDCLASTVLPMADIYGALGACMMFIIIAIAVGFFIYSGTCTNKWKILQQERYATDFATSGYINQKMAEYKPTYTISLIVGICLCILSVTPSIIIDAFVSRFPSVWLENLSGVLLFVFVAVGVFLIVLSCNQMSIYNKLLSLNNNNFYGNNRVYGNNYNNPQGNNNAYNNYNNPGGSNYYNAPNSKVVYNNKTVAAIMSVFWPTITCIYLCISFLTFDWHITWIIWPIAAIINTLVENTLGHK